MIFLAAEYAEHFGRLYDDNQAKVYRLALGLTGNANEAEEITQEAFFRAFRSYGAFRAESSFFTWIYRITINVANDYLKQRKKLPIHMLTEDLGYSLDEVIDPDPASDPESVLLANEARYKCLHCMTECLTAGQRKAFCLTVTLGLPYRLAAEILDCSPGAVKATLHRAKQRWAGYMENRCQLIKKTNPCNCAQWVRFGLERGWLVKGTRLNPRPPVDVRVREEIVGLRTLRDIYSQMYREAADAELAERIKRGVAEGEWIFFS
ncbi:MAG TPA: RNA polymerase sigma factor [Negativicutes bacterium]|nr:RNA polymerase sigma factor [Negativicutes bacterium]